MLRLDAVNISAKLGVRVNIATLERIELKGKQVCVHVCALNGYSRARRCSHANVQITELGNFCNFVSLVAVVLPQNRIERLRNIEVGRRCILVCVRALKLSKGALRLREARRAGLAREPHPTHAELPAGDGCEYSIVTHP